ncbi:MAG: LysE family translocator, partial [Gammaproteobacteria bacterium]|nr:LysE family translocator [Gammaproteobacteria bacterium]
PGPGVFAIIARALVSGARSCTMLSLGMAVSDCIYLVLACLGLAAIATHWGEVFTVIRLGGAAYLFYLGWKIWTAPVHLSPDSDIAPAAGPGPSFLQGFLISASNPKVIVFYIAFLPTFMDLGSLSARDIVLAVVLALSALMLGLVLIAATAARARYWFRSAGAMRGLNRGAGSIMAAAGAYLALRS